MKVARVSGIVSHRHDVTVKESTLSDLLKQHTQPRIKQLKDCYSLAINGRWQISPNQNQVFQRALIIDAISVEPPPPPQQNY